MNKVKNKVKLTQSDLIFTIFNYIFLSLAFLIVILPIIHIVSSSFSSGSAVSSGKVFLFPVDFSLKGYEEVFKHKYVMPSFANSIFYATAGTVINIILTVLAAYPLSRKEFKYRNIFMVFFMFTMFFGGGLIPNYILMSQLGLINTRVILLLCAAISVHNMIITRTFFASTIPNELLEAARIDGLGEFGIFLRIVMPLSKAILAVIALYYAIAHWNTYFNAMIYLSDKDLFPLQLILREILILNTLDFSNMTGADAEMMEALQGMSDLLKYSLIVVASAPVLAIYPFVQKHFVKGVMIGSVKG